MSDIPPKDVATTTLASECSRIQWLHDRTKVRIPLGRKAFAVLKAEEVNSPFTQLTATRFYEHGVQPLVLSPLPPLMKLLTSGCGCARCERRAMRHADDPQVARDWITAHQLLLFYSAVVHRNAVHRLTPKRCAQQVNDFTVSMRKWCLQTLELHHNQGPESEVEKMWQAVWCALEADPYDEQAAVMALLPLAHAMAQQPGYTMYLIHLMEGFVWAAILRCAPSAEDRDRVQLAALVPPHLWMCPLDRVKTRDSWVLDDATRSEVDEWTKLQEQGLRCVSCGPDGGHALAQWPSFKLPFLDAVVVCATTAAADPHDCVSLASSVYTVLSFFYVDLMHRRAPVHTKVPGSDGGGLSTTTTSPKMVLTDGQHGDVPNVLAKD